MAMGSLEMTSDEILAYLQHSGLPTILVEGIGDSGLLRRLERDLSSSGVDVMPVGGKLRLHEIYLRRKEVVSKVVVFLRDRDEYVVCDVPPDYGDYVFTGGYSIENDAISREAMLSLCGASFGRLLTLISLVSCWFRCALQRYVVDGKTHDISRDVSWIVRDGVHSPEAEAEIVATKLVSPFEGLADDTAWIWLRGKTLLRAIHYFFQSQEVSYNKVQIIDVCTKLAPSPTYQELIGRLREKVESLEIAVARLDAEEIALPRN